MKIQRKLPAEPRRIGTPEHLLEADMRCYHNINNLKYRVPLLVYSVGRMGQSSIQWV